MQVTPENTIGTKTFHLQGALTRATVIARRDEDGFRLGISICSLADQFSRKRGRMIAFGRLNTGLHEARENGRGYYFLPGNDPLAEKTHQVRAEIQHLFTRTTSITDLDLIAEMSKLVAALSQHLELTVAQIVDQKAAAAV